MQASQRFARRVFLGAGAYGILALAPQYFLEDKLGRDYPPAITHPEHYYGFIGVALAWQLAFLVIASDVRRFRPLMPVAVVEKLVFAIPAFALLAAGRVAPAVAVFGAIDLLLAVLFSLAWLRTRERAEPSIASAG